MHTMHIPPVDRHRAALLHRTVELQKQQPPLHWYALVETGLHPALPGQLARLDGRSVALFDGTPEQDLAYHSPRLVDLGPGAAGQPVQASVIDEVLNFTRASPCVSWIASSQTLHALAGHLRGWLDGRLLDDDGNELGDVIVRFTDTRVLPGFMDAITPEQYGELMRPIALWAVWLRSHRWQEWTPPEINPWRPLPPMQAYTVQQQARIELSTRVDRIHARIEDQVAEIQDTDPMARAISQHFLALPHDLRFQRLDKVLQRATRHGLHTDADLQAYGWLALGVHERFDEHGAVREAIAGAVRAGSSLSEAIADLPDSVWDALQAQAQAQ